MTACGKKVEPSPPVPLPPVAAPAVAPAPLRVVDFDVAKLTSEHGVANKDEYIPVSRLKKEPFRVAVLATWCPYSLMFLEHAKNDPSIAAEYLLVVYEDEFSAKVKSEEKKDETSSDDAKSLLDAPENRGRMVWDADEALKFGLPIYVIKSGTFRSEIEGFPTRLSCSQGVCSKAGLAISEAKAIARSHPEMLEEIKAQLPETHRQRVENDPELLISVLAKIVIDQEGKSEK